MSSKIRFLPRISVEDVPILTGVGDLEPSRLKKEGSNDGRCIRKIRLVALFASIYAPFQSGVDASESDR